jgi:hypothetical protein
MLVWILQQVEMPPQDAEQFCNDPKIIEEALNALVGALFNVIYGAVKGLPVVAAARVLCGHRYEDLAAFFRPLPSPEPGAMYVLMHELRQFVRQQPDIQFNPTWGRWTWPVCVSATPAAPTPARPSESAVTNKAEPLPNSKIESEESQPPNKPHSVDAPMPVNVGYVDPTIAHALAHATKRARPAYTEDASIIAEIVESLSDLPARSGEAKAPGSDPAARAEESMPGPEPEPEPKPEPEPEPELAKAEHTRWQRDRTIER